MATGEVVESLSLPDSQHAVADVDITEWDVLREPRKEVPRSVLASQKSFRVGRQEPEPEPESVLAQISRHLIASELLLCNRVSARWAIPKSVLLVVMPVLHVLLLRFRLLISECIEPSSVPERIIRTFELLVRCECTLPKNHSCVADLTRVVGRGKCFKIAAEVKKQTFRQVVLGVIVNHLLFRLEELHVHDSFLLRS